MNTPTALVLLPLAVQKGPDPADVKPGWLGFTVFLVLAVAVALLAMSFVKQLKKIDFEEEPDSPPAEGREGDPSSTPQNPSQA